MGRNNAHVRPFYRTVIPSDKLLSQNRPFPRFRVNLQPTQTIELAEHQTRIPYRQKRAICAKKAHRDAGR